MTVRGQFETAAEGINACEAIVDGWLVSACEPGMCATALYGLYRIFGDDPFSCRSIQKALPAVNFSAWQYARHRCEALAVS